MIKFSEPDPNTLRPLLVRAVAQALLSIFRQKQYADKVIEHTLRQSPKAGSRDRAFIAETTYDIVRHYRLYEVVLGRAPVSEQDFWKICGIHFIKLGRALPDWSEFRGLDEAEIRAEIAELQAVRKLRESVPDWLDELGAAELGDDVWAETLTQLNRPAQVVLRANTLKTNALDLKKALAAEGIETNLVEADAVVLHRRQNVFQSQSFKNGLFEVQDFSSQMVAAMLALQPGMRVVDACAGGGGKTLHLAALMQNRGSLIALDTLDWKLGELKIRARRAGATNIETRHIENRKVIKRLHGTADRLLLDVPCSGLGVLRRNPDSKWKLTPEFVENLRVTQADILQSYSLICKPGGRMVYATCSVLPSENQAQVTKFLASEAGQQFRLLEEKRVLPQDRGFDGFYMALLERQ